MSNKKTASAPIGALGRPGPQLNISSSITWNFLRDYDRLTEAQIFELGPEQVIEYAGDFVDYGPGKDYWPLEGGQWKHTADRETIQAQVADNMTLVITTRRKGQTETPQRAGGSVAALRSMPSTTKIAFLGNLDTREVTVEAGSDDDLSIFSLPRSNPDEAHTTQQTQLQAQNRDITSVSIRKDDGLSDAAEPVPKIQSPAKRPATSRTKKSVTPKVPRRRVARNISNPKQNEKCKAAASRLQSEPDMASTSQPTPPPSTAAKGTKRNLNADAADDDGQDAIATPASVGRHVRPRLETFSPASDVVGIIPRVNRDDEGSGDPVSSSHSPTRTVVQAYGAWYELDRLASLPAALLDYVRQCSHDSEAAAAEETDEVVRTTHLNKATLYRDLHWDLESRVRAAAVDFENVEKSGARKTRGVVASLCRRHG